MSSGINKNLLLSIVSDIVTVNSNDVIILIIMIHFLCECLYKDFIQLSWVLHNNYDNFLIPLNMICMHTCMHKCLHELNNSDLQSRVKFPNAISSLLQTRRGYPLERTRSCTTLPCWNASCSILVARLIYVLHDTWNIIL